VDLEACLGGGHTAVHSVGVGAEVQREHNTEVPVLEAPGDS
jgi:hypothetical protein